MLCSTSHVTNGWVWLLLQRTSCLVLSLAASPLQAVPRSADQTLLAGRDAKDAKDAKAGLAQWGVPRHVVDRALAEAGVPVVRVKLLVLVLVLLSSHWSILAGEEEGVSRHQRRRSLATGVATGTSCCGVVEDCLHCYSS